MKITWSRRLSDADAHAYDAFVEASPLGHYTQATAWAPLATMGKLLSPRFVVARRDQEIVGAAMVTVGSAGPLRLPFASFERGPACSIADLPDVLSAMRSAAHRHGAAHLSVMPYAAAELVSTVERIVTSDGFRRDHPPDGPHACTLRIDLDDDILSGKEGKSLRQRIRQAEKFEVRAANEGAAGAAVLAEMHTRLMKDQKMGAKSPAWFKALATFIEAKPSHGATLVARHDGKPVSAAFVVRHGKMITWLLGATSPEHTTAYSKMVPTVMEALAWGRRNGASVFDMGGVPPAGDTDEKRQKIAQFKYYFARNPISLVRRHVRWF